MERGQVVEFHYITSISNVTSILQVGILSNRRAAQLPHASIAAQDVQDRRAQKPVPGGRPLHEYANLYFHARNPMMFRRKALHSQICVLQVSTDVLDLEETVVATQNASSDYVAFRPASAGLAMLDYELVFARDWRDPDQITYFRKKSGRCAELLVPDRVPPELIVGVVCSCEESARTVRAVCDRPVSVDPDLFFQEAS